MAFIANIPTGRITYKNLYTRVEKVEFLKGDMVRIEFAAYQEEPAAGDIPLVITNKEVFGIQGTIADPFEYAYLNTKHLFDIVQDNV